VAGLGLIEGKVVTPSDYSDAGTGTSIEQRPTGTRRTVNESFSTKRNSLNFLRLVLALMVVLSHAFVGGFTDPLLLNHTSLGNIGVYGFFAISGYLIASSASHNSLGRYLWQRFLRIFPAFWVCLVMVGFVFAALAWVTVPKSHPPCGFSACYLGSPTGPLQYIYHNFLLRINQTKIANTPSGVPWPASWDGPLWTLFYEFTCYLILAALAFLGLLRHRLVVLWLAVSAWTCELIVGLVHPNLNSHYTYWAFLVLIPIFLTGSLLYLYREKVPDSGWLALALAAVFFASPWLPFGVTWTPLGTAIYASQVLAPLFVYPIFWLGIHLPFHKVGSRNDYSYGIYIYAFVIQQLLATWDVQRWGYLAFMSLSVLCTLPFAAASWWIIERNALKFRKLEPRTVRDRIVGSNPARALTPEPASEREPTASE
jgi:peptidoglycan/LPS O-acetylase OafA/YrhL